MAKSPLGYSKNVEKWNTLRRLCTVPSKPLKQAKKHSKS